MSRDSTLAEFIPTMAGSQFRLHDMARTVLIIDDNKSVRDLLSFLLARRGYDVLVAEDGPAGLALAARQSIAGALVDVNMPGMNGVEVCKALRELAAKEGRTVAVWLMTGAPTTEGEKAALEAGALMLLAKPFDVPDLLKRIQTEIGAPTPPGTKKDEQDLF
jgi:DNA-binding response OmpR family regulator